MKVLIDSGASATIISKEFVKKLKVKKETATSWDMATGMFTTTGKVNLKIQFPELSLSAIVHMESHIHKGQLASYNMILGRNDLTELGIDIKFSTQSIEWLRMNATIPMKPRDATPYTHFFVDKDVSMDKETDRLSSILNAKYSAYDLPEYVARQSHLDKKEQQLLLMLLENLSTLFDRSLGKWEGEPYHVQLREGATPYHGSPYTVPKAYKQTLKLELDRLVRIEVLKKVNCSEWAFPSFIIPKKDSSVKFINDLWELNRRIKRVPYPLPKIQEMLLKLEGFQYATALDLNMGYYHIRLDPASKKLCKLVFPWGKCEMQCLPMGLSNSPDIFQEKMSKLFLDLETVQAYIDNLLVITKGSYDNHLEEVGKVLFQLRKAGLKVNARKLFFAQPKLEYLGYWITIEGIQPQPKKIEGIIKIAPPKNQMQL